MFASVLFVLNILAIPKSEILGFMSWSRRILLALRSLCMTRNLECLCKYRSPCAIPSIIARRIFQFSKALLVSSANQLSIDISEKNFGTKNLSNDLVKLSTKNKKVKAFIWQTFID